MGLFDIFKKEKSFENKTERTIIQDDVFGKLENEKNYGFYGKVKLNFFETEYDVKICINSSSNKIEEIQYESFKAFIQKFKLIEEDIIIKLLQYYNGGEGVLAEKYAYGPEDEEENKTWWPDINTKEDMIKNIHFDSIIIQEGFLLNNERRIYILFNRDWGGPDNDDNGVAVEIINEKVTGVGYKDIAY